MKFQKPRGTQDIYDIKMQYFNFVSNICEKVANSFNFNKIITPIFEELQIYQRSVGETSDIVKKELFLLQEKSNKIYALRPEGTASVIRSYVENKMFGNNTLETKLFYIENMFRYERPQTGRLREFFQFGVEIINPTNYWSDVELVCIGKEILDQLFISNYTIKINYLGSIESRNKWINALREYFIPYKDQLNELNIQRIDSNPIRILDDKEDGLKDFVKNAPKLDQFLSKDDINIFNSICLGLKQVGIEYEIDSSLVRGLDYYTGFIFEFVSNDKILSGQNTVIGGGRYAGLIKEFDGPDYEATGFALGIERIINLIQNNPNITQLIKDNKITSVLIATDLDQNINKIMLIANNLRKLNLNVSLIYNGSKREKAVKKAINNEINYFIYLSEADMNNNVIEIQDLFNKITQKVKIEDINNYF